MDTEVAKEKILKYCAYQERSQKEVKNKLYEMGLYTGQVNEILVYLIQEDYLNEERFAFLYAGSKRSWSESNASMSMLLPADHAPSDTTSSTNKPENEVCLLPT